MNMDKNKEVEPVDITGPNETADAAFIQRVYDAVATITAGKVATYGQIAELAGEPQWAREVGVILSRVTEGDSLNRTGVLAPDYVFGGKERQRAMLEAEGVTFLGDGRINMDRHLFGAPEQIMLDLD